MTAAVTTATEMTTAVTAAAEMTTAVTTAVTAAAVTATPSVRGAWSSYNGHNQTKHHDQ
jgi:hypothetical protein